ncbi:hypothetical protein F2P56_019157 [Juglans regia]|uniref:RNase H type-1 domain-containing protein n=2 Tax=Juglans regia TaxID=51240 RepID=A0A833XB56_JUGRE|nr:uncharacterized protein LOC108984645 [Juglans regia]KAF5463227.1 hypothetical protein F2P56_019157 [Juglans regia]
MRIGIIIRDEEGKALVAECDLKNNVVNAVVAESLVLRKASELCSELNIQEAIFEGNAKEVVEAVLSEEEVVLDYSSIIEDVKFHFRNMTHWFIQFVSRKKNTVAHTLANKALEIGEELVWIEEVPDFIVGCLLDDTNCNT